MTNSIPIWRTPDGTLACADCVDWIPTLPPESVRLVAVDPPFFTKRTQVGGGENPPTYEDRWAGGKGAYVSWLMDRLALAWDRLLPDGSLLVHLDWHAVHAVKAALDERFGEKRFQNEIIWVYQTGGAGSRRFSRKHDTLLWYTKSESSWVFRPERIPIPRTPKALHRARNPKGARIAADDLHKNPEDVVSIPALNPMSSERTGYPTQKPVELMEWFILALSDEGEVVADFFCGSGTTLVAAQRLGRKWLGCDVSPEAVGIAKERLAKAGGALNPK